MMEAQRQFHRKMSFTLYKKKNDFDLELGFHLKNVISFKNQKYLNEIPYYYQHQKKITNYRNKILFLYGLTKKNIQEFKIFRHIKKYTGSTVYK